MLISGKKEAIKVIANPCKPHKLADQWLSPLALAWQQPGWLISCLSATRIFNKHQNVDLKITSDHNLAMSHFRKACAGNTAFLNA